ncbi:cell envelope integrity TolA C-terminal domain-containing protein [Erwinia sp.]|uniref:cell envelope integrity TolA C-terminal domain-containing protein n=1 Tax=Erwinia citreus TaxID=558 RepID=UPI003C74336A
MNRTKMRVLTATLMVTLLAGCQSLQSDRHDKMQPASREELQAYADKSCQKPPPGASQEECRYFAQMSYGIQRNFYDHQRYIGRECLLTIRWNDATDSYSVLSTSGDEQLCKSAWGVVSSAENLPAPPKKFPSEIVIDFKPAG